MKPDASSVKPSSLSSYGITPRRDKSDRALPHPNLPVHASGHGSACRFMIPDPWSGLWSGRAKGEGRDGAGRNASPGLGRLGTVTGQHANFGPEAKLWLKRHT